MSSKHFLFVFPLFQLLLATGALARDFSGQAASGGLSFRATFYLVSLLVVPVAAAIFYLRRQHEPFPYDRFLIGSVLIIFATTIAGIINWIFS